MTYDRQHLSIDWLFDIDGTDEVAVTGLNYSVAAGWANAGAALTEIGSSGNDAANRCLDAMNDFISSGSGLFWANYSRLLGVKIAAVGTDGKYINVPLNPFTYPNAPATRGTDTAVLPQSSVVLTLKSGQSLGSANYGRMYIPHVRMNLNGSTPYVENGSMLLIVEQGKIFINTVTAALQDQTPYELNPTIMTNKTGAASKLVADLAVGNVIDTQRRRRNRLKEQYSVTTL